MKPLYSHLHVYIQKKLIEFIAPKVPPIYVIILNELCKALPERDLAQWAHTFSFTRNNVSTKLETLNKKVIIIII
jgi:hypothetical protein